LLSARAMGTGAFGRIFINKQAVSGWSSCRVTFPGYTLTAPTPKFTSANMVDGLKTGHFTAKGRPRRAALHFGNMGGFSCQAGRDIGRCICPVSSGRPAKPIVVPVQKPQACGNAFRFSVSIVRRLSQARPDDGITSAHQTGGGGKRFFLFDRHHKVGQPRFSHRLSAYVAAGICGKTSFALDGASAAGFQRNRLFSSRHHQQKAQPLSMTLACFAIARRID